MRNLFSSAAALLLGEPSGPAANHDVDTLLDELGYRPSPGAETERQTRHRARLLQAASRFNRMFEVAAPDAPGLVAFGAEFDPGIAGPQHGGSPPVGVSGIGVTMQDAFQGCVGEGVEYLSQLQREGDALIVSDAATGLARLDEAARHMITALTPPAALSWHPVKRLFDGTELRLPTDLCLRRPAAAQDFAPPFPLSIGSAAGTSWEGAALHGLLELIERDAASLWWRGGRRGRAVAPEVEAGAAALLGQLRAGAQTARRSWLLDITSDIGVPSVAALSCGPDGRGLAFGLAARPSLQAAARSAVLEMCQIELALAVVQAKLRERGEAALNAKDHSHLRRARAIDAEGCVLLQPVPLETEHLVIDSTDPKAALEAIVRRLGELGIESYGLDLTRAQFDIPVARIIVPALQIEPSGLVSARLSSIIEKTGGGEAHTGGISLI